MGKSVEIKTEHVIPFKTLFEVLKEVLNDVIVEFKQDEEMNKKPSDDGKTEKKLKNDDEEDEDENSENEASNDEAEAEADEDEGDDKDEKTKSEKKDEEKSGGIKIMTVDHTKTLLIHVKLNAKQFSVFKVKKKCHDVGISLVHLHKLIKSLDKDDTLSMYIDEEDKQNIVLKVDNDEKNYKTIYRLKLMDINKTSYKIPQTPFESVIVMDSGEFHKICREMSQIAEYIDIKCTNNSITFTCKGDCAERSTTYTSDENGVKIRMSNNKNKNTIVQGIFELKYLVMFTKCANLCNDIQIFMRNDYPLFIKYTVATLGTIQLGIVPTDEKHINSNFDDDDALYSDEEKE
jgi:proliferating cell nuclear antigen